MDDKSPEPLTASGIPPTRLRLLGWSIGEWALLASAAAVSVFVAMPIRLKRLPSVLDVPVFVAQMSICAFFAFISLRSKRR
jgi:hypothetical protein